MRASLPVAAVAALGALWASAPAGAQGGDDLVRVRMVGEQAAAAPGETVRVGVVFEIAPEWHLYWRNPGDTGVAPTIDLRLPQGVVAGAVEWPAPRRYVHGNGMLLDYIHEGVLTLVVPLHLSSDLEPGADLAIEAFVEWLACQEACIPGLATVGLTLPVADSASGATPSAEAPIFGAFDAASARPFSLAQERGVRVAWRGNYLEIVAPGATELIFYPDEPRVGGPVDPIRGCVAEGERLLLEYGATAADAGRVTGVLEARGGGASGRWEIAAPAPPAG